MVPRSRALLSASLALVALAVLVACAPATSSSTAGAGGRATAIRDGQFGSTYAGFYYGVGEEYNRDFFDVGGRVSFEDTGFTTIGCGSSDVLNYFMNEVRRTGATTFEVTRFNAPDFFSTCWRGQATLLVRNDRPWPSDPVNETEARTYLDGQTGGLDRIEGIWLGQNSRSKWFIRRIDESRFVALVLESQDPLWRPGMIRAQIESTQASAYPATVWTETLQGFNTVIALDPSGLSFTFRITVNNGIDRFLPLEVAETYFRQYPAIPGAAPGSQGSEVARPEIASGSGVLLTEDGVVATAAHVVSGASSIRVVVGGNEYDAEVVAVDVSNDVALIQVRGFRGSSQIATIGDDAALRLGARVAAIGFPFSSRLGESPTYTEGTVSSLSAGFLDDARLIQISAPVQPGNSGGPLFNEVGEVIGIVMATLDPLWTIENRGAIPQNVNYAVRISYLMNLARIRSVSIPDRVSQPPQVLSSADLAELGSQVVVQIVATLD